MLTETSLSITEIANSLGFSDNPLYFNSYFKSFVGIYPSLYRKENSTNTKTNKYSAKFLNDRIDNINKNKK